MTAYTALQALTPEYLIKEGSLTMRINLTLLEKAKTELYKYYQQHYAARSSAVAMERIFSGGRDIISLRRASLQP